MWAVPFRRPRGLQAATVPASPSRSPSALTPNTGRHLTERLPSRFTQHRPVTLTKAGSEQCAKTGLRFKKQPRGHISCLRSVDVVASLFPVTQQAGYLRHLLLTPGPWTKPSGLAWGTSVTSPNTEKINVNLEWVVFLKKKFIYF